MHVARCRISKANVCGYRGWEIPDHQAMGLDPNRTYMLYRDPAELRAAAATFQNIPLLINHVPISAEYPERDAWVGTTGSSVEFDGQYLVTDILSVWTQEAIALIESGQQEQLSPSYRYRADMTPGETPQGVRFDGRMLNIIGNHVAIVEEGRTGPDVIVADAQPRKTTVKPKNPVLFAALKAIARADVTDAQLMAVDAALDEAVPREKAWDGWSDEDKKAAQDEWKDTNGKGANDAMSDEEEAACWKSAKDKRAKDAIGVAGLPAASDSRPRPAATPKALTQADINRAVQLAEDGTTKRITALFAAKEAVRPLVGEVVACDSAEAVYRFALGKLSVPVEDIHPSAFPALYAMAAKNHQTTAVQTARQRPAMDAAGHTAMANALPILGNINVAH